MPESNEKHEKENNKDIYFSKLHTVDLTNLKLNGRILDIGGGGEGVIGQFAGPHVIAIDPSERESEEAQNISVVGPSTSYSASHQQIPKYHHQRYTIKYHEAEDVAKEVYEAYKDQTMITRITGFCMIMSREMIDKIGCLLAS